jgi:plasmid stabilization system protein ParE
MAEVIWSPDALRDLDQICEHVARGSEHYALVFAQEVLALTRSIPVQPLLGAAVPEWGRDEIRERQLHDYRVIYRVRDPDVEIVTIIHGSRRLPRTPPN